MQRVYSLIVDNTTGVLSRISGLFSRRGYSIDSITAGVTADPRFTRITIVASGDELILAQIDTRLIVQVIINIVDNGIKYTPAGSSIWISLSRQEDQVWVSISDDGPGIPDEKKERVFEMFYTGADQIADSRRSLGLGLSLCRSIVTAHGGRIWVSDRPGGGAVFTFTLPAGEVEAHEQTVDLSGGG